MQPMKDFDWSDLDVRLLTALVAITETGSVTAAAERLDVTQSSVSHMLQKLRGIVGDPLFVKSGRGIVPTARAETLSVQARVLLDEMRRFATADTFDPATLEKTFKIAANDLQRDLLLPRLLRRLRAEAPGVSLRVVPSNVPTAAMLREEACDLVISPRPPDAGDIVHKRLFSTHYRVFRDPAMGPAPADLHAYLAADHVTVLYDPPRPLDFDHAIAERGIRRRIVASVPGFAGIASFVRGSPSLASAPALLGAGQLRDLASSPLPFDHPPMPMYVMWHLRHRHDPVHAWLRSALEAIVAEALGEILDPEAGPL